jgi:hypothetical protein
MTATLTRRAGALTVIAATTIALAGCGGVGARVTYDDTEQVKVTDIEIDGDSGNVAVKTAAIGETHIKRIYRASTDPDKLPYRLDGTVLHVTTGCGIACRVSYEIEAPTGVAVHGEFSSGGAALTDVGKVDLKVSSGDITIKGATGPVKVTATSGDIRINDAKAGVTMQVTSGDIEAIDITGPVVAKVNSGEAHVTLRTPGSVTAQVDSGDLGLVVPQGDYQVRSKVGSGDLNNGGVANVPGAKNILDLRIGSGDLSVATA